MTGKVPVLFIDVRRKPRSTLITRLPRRTRYQISLITPRLCRSRYQIKYDNSPASWTRYQSTHGSTNSARALHSGFVVVCQRLKLYCTQPYGFVCQPLRCTALVLTDSFVSGKSHLVRTSIARGIIGQNHL